MNNTSGVSQMLSGALKSMGVANESVAKLLTDAANEPDLSTKVDVVIDANKKANAIMQDLMTLLHSNAFITSVVMDNVVPNASQTTAMNTMGVVPDTISNATSIGIMTGTTVHGIASSMDATSQVTVSVEDLLSPMKISSAKPKPVTNPAPQCNLMVDKAKSLNSLADPKQLFSPTPSTPNRPLDPLAGIRIS